jgi:uncharacterized protein YaaN involved in tellurite resistance
MLYQYFGKKILVFIARLLRQKEPLERDDLFFELWAKRTTQKINHLAPQSSFGGEAAVFYFKKLPKY